MKARLQKLIAQGKTPQAIRQLLKITQQLKKADLYNEVILQSGRFETYEKAKRQGLASFEEKGISLAQIHRALLEITDRLTNEEWAQVFGEAEPQVILVPDPFFSGRWWQWGLGLGVVIAILVSIVSFSGYDLLDFGEMDAFSVTVLVHGKKGKDHRILRDQGKVVLDIGNTREEENINSQGEATFKGLSNSYRGKRAIISIDHAQPYFPTQRDVEYILTENKAIYLEVQLEGLHKIQGQIIDFETEQPLDSVRVSVQDTATYSNSFGWYELHNHLITPII